LTGDNLSKRGFLGPFKCVLCKESLETINHLFLECSFSRVVWKVLLQDLSTRVNWPRTIAQLFSRCKNRYRGSFYKNAIFQRIWLALPKYIFWKLWLARNKVIFVGDIGILSTVANKAISLLCEQFNHKRKSDNSLEFLDIKERVWVDRFSLQFQAKAYVSHHPP